MKRQYGFTLTEIMVSLIVAAIALLGLGKAQLVSLQHATNAMYYTQASIHVHNTTEKLWIKACEFQTNPEGFEDLGYRQSLQPGGLFELVLPDEYNKQMLIKVSWLDGKIDDGNSVEMNAVFPELC